MTDTAWTPDQPLVSIRDLHKICEALLEYETLSGAEVHALLRGETIERDDNRETPDDAAATSVPSTDKSRGGRESPGGMSPTPQPES